MIDAILRYRTWVVMLVVVVVAVGAGALARRSRPGGLRVGANPPAQLRFGARVPLPAAVRGLDYTNGWMVVADSGRAGVDVYAGAQAAHRGNGLLVVVRTDAGGRRSVRSVILPGSGPVTLLRPAATVTTVADAATATLRFVTASGRLGSLQLARDAITFS